MGSLVSECGTWLSPLACLVGLPGLRPREAVPAHSVARVPQHLSPLEIVFRHCSPRPHN
jgi:hypothetical protein